MASLATIQTNCPCFMEGSSVYYFQAMLNKKSNRLQSTRANNKPYDSKPKDFSS